MGLIFGIAASPIYLGFAANGHNNLGALLWFAMCIGLTVAYVRRTRFRTIMQSLVPTSQEQAEKSGDETD